METSSTSVSAVTGAAGAWGSNAPPGESVFYSLYYLTVGLHGLHVLIGGALLTVVALRVHKGTVHAGNFVLLENSAEATHRVGRILTGHLLKDPESVIDYHRDALPGITAKFPNAIRRSDPELQAVLSAMGD